MTAVPIPPGGPPNPADVAAASHRLRTSGPRLAPVRGLPPARELRPSVEPVENAGAAVERDRARWADCSRGAHVWTSTPMGLVCLHCPVPKDQAARVQAARRARVSG